MEARKYRKRRVWSEEEKARGKTKNGREGWTEGGTEEAGEREGGKLIHKDTENV